MFQYYPLYNLHMYLPFLQTIDNNKLIPQIPTLDTLICLLGLSIFVTEIPYILYKKKILKVLL